MDYGYLMRAMSYLALQLIRSRSMVLRNTMGQITINHSIEYAENEVGLLHLPFHWWEMMQMYSLATQKKVKTIRTYSVF